MRPGHGSAEHRCCGRLSSGWGHSRGVRESVREKLEDYAGRPWGAFAIGGLQRWGHDAYAVPCA